MDTVNTFTTGIVAAWTAVITFVPKLLAFAAILLIGYFLAGWIRKLVNTLLERIHFDQMVERGGIKRAMERSGYDASDLVSQLAYYGMMLFVLQLAFGVFGPNPVSDLLNGVIAYLPNVFVAVLIVVVTAFVANAVRDLVQGSLGGLTYGRTLATVASVSILVVGIFAALSQLHIAPYIVNGLFYAMLAIVVGSAIVAIGGGGIQPMRQQWEKAMMRMEQEAPRMREEMQNASLRVETAVDATDDGGARIYEVPDETRRSA